MSGATVTNELVNIPDFYRQHILPDLQAADIQEVWPISRLRVFTIWFQQSQVLLLYKQSVRVHDATHALVCSQSRCAAEDRTWPGASLACVRLPIPSSVLQGLVLQAGVLPFKVDADKCNEG